MKKKWTPEYSLIYHTLLYSMCICSTFIVVYCIIFSFPHMISMFNFTFSTQMSSLKTTNKDMHESFLEAC